MNQDQDQDQENDLVNIHLLVCSSTTGHEHELDYIKKNFCGKVIENIEKLEDNVCENSILYICGNVDNVINKLGNTKYLSAFAIDGMTCSNDNTELISAGKIPLNINNVGVFFREYFDTETDFFKCLNDEHNFQTLTESNKPSNSYRKGLYITEVTKKSVDGVEDSVENSTDEEISFNLLRCSTNLDGPTDNFRPIDKQIIESVNDIGNKFFKLKTDINHVLAQVYHNSKIDDKDKKARIKNHSDKTKDMPRDATMAFCTFYDFSSCEKKLTKEGYDHMYKKSTALTILRFRLKKETESEESEDLPKLFDVVLYPNSIFMMSLKTNRLYTHEIVPSALPVEYLPTRLGYVARCSKTKAVYKNGKTYIVDQNHNLVELHRPEIDDTKQLKELYSKENSSTELITYGDVLFSLNDGDYMKPNM